MKRKMAISFLAGLIAFPLAACSTNTSTSSSSSIPDSSSSSVIPIQLYDNYRRDGVLRFGIEAGILSTQLQMEYKSPISLFYQADEKKQYGDDASLQVYPFEVSGTENQKLEQAEINRRALQALMSTTYSISQQEGYDVGMLPILLDRYSTSFSSWGDVPSGETISFDSIDGTAVIYNTTGQESEEELRYFHEGSNLSETLNNVDLSTIQVNVPSLLEFLNEISPSEEVLQPFFSTIGDISYFLFKGMTLSIESIGTDESVINFSINDEGRKILEDKLEQMAGIPLDAIKIANLEFSIDVFNDEKLINQIGSVEFILELTGTDSFFGQNANVKVYMDANLKKEASSIGADFFDERSNMVSLYKGIYEEAEPFFETVKDYAPFKTTLTGEEDEDYSKIDLSDSIVTTMTSAGENYFFLSEDAKKLLGTVFANSASSQEDLVDMLLSRYRKGVEKVSTMLEEFQLNPSVNEDNFGSLFDSIVVYANWQQGVIDQGGQEALDALIDYLQERAKTITGILSGTENNALDQFLLNSTEENLTAAVELDRRLNELMSLNSGYLVGEIAKEYEEIDSQFSEFQKKLHEKFYIYLTKKLVTCDYSGLSELASSEAVNNPDFFDRSLLETDDLEIVRSLLETESKEIRQNLISSASSSAALELAYLSVASRMTTLRRNESTFLGTDEYYEGIFSLYQSLLSSF